MKRRLKVLPISFLLLCSEVSAGDSDVLQGLDGRITKGMADWNITGLAVGIVKDNETVYARGFGVRSIDTGDLVDENTVFAVGSNTKLMTATVLGLLVQEEKITWDSRVIDLMPEFRLKDPLVTREVTVKDLLSHRAGLPREDFLWYGSHDYDRKEIVHRLRLLTGGELIPSVTGESWDQFLIDRVFRPLGMDRSVTSVHPLKHMDNVAQPHIESQGETVRVPYRDIDNVGPAGSVNSSVVDMIQWMKLHLNAGNVEGEQIADTSVVDMTHTPHNPFFVSRKAREIFPATNFRAYGLGVGLSDYHGRKLLLHTGGIDGMLSLVGMVPEEKLGVVILTNYSPNNFRHALFYTILDSFLDVDTRDWNDFYLGEFTKARARLGSYTHEAYGTVEVSRERRQLLMKHWGSPLMGDLDHWQNNTYRVTWDDPTMKDDTDRLFVNFQIDSQGRIKSLSVELLRDFDEKDGPQFQEIVFKKGKPE